MEGRDPSQLEAMVDAAEAAAAQGRAEPDDTRLEVINAELERMAGATVAKLGLEGLRLGELNRHNDAALRVAAEEARQLGREAAADHARRLESMVSAWRRGLIDSPDLLGGNTELLLSVDFIRSWANPGNLLFWRQLPGLNWAEYRVEEKHGAIRRTGTERVSFYNHWHNPHAHDVLIDVQVRMTVNGHLSAHADGGGVSSWFFPNSRARAGVSARLTLWQLWADPAPQVIVDTRPVASVSAEGGFLGGMDNTPVSEAPAVSTTGFWVRGGSEILIETSLVVDYEALNGGVEADFASDDLFTVGWAYATVTVPHPGVTG